MQVLSEDDKTFGNGMAGLIAGGEGTARSTAMFDNLIISPVGAAAPEPTVFSQDSDPIYR
jgi:hypothetical protein